MEGLATLVTNANLNQRKEVQLGMGIGQKPPDREFVETPRPLTITSGEKRWAGALRASLRLQQQQ